MKQRKSGNLFAHIPHPDPGEVVTALLRHGPMAIERIVSLGQVTPAGTWLEQDSHEWVVLVQGAAKLLFDGEEKLFYMQPGDWCEIPAQCRHRVEWTDPTQKTVWIAVHYK
ncbi:MAG: hypothetical protein PHO30_08695 [Candidatus Omnitrophica bacterium]|nr:hypothetical protein [Candidatus Omnitrophota bacterium]